MSQEKPTPEELKQILADHLLWRQSYGAKGKQANLVRANLVRANLDGANLDGANLDGANLDGAYLVRANLDGAYLVRANLVRANLAGANLDGAYLVRANLDGAYLIRANLVRANLAGANLAGAYLVRANLAGANLDGAYLDGAYLDGAYLVRANLDGARGFEPFICVGPIGSRQAYTTVFLYQDKIVCGCFTGTLAQFESKVRRTHADNPAHLAEYMGLIAYAKVLREAQPERPAQEPEPPAPFAEGARVRLTAAGKEKYPWATSDQGDVTSCAGGWTRIEFDDCYMSFANEFVERVEEAEKAAS
jgi:hypothetical protein